MIAKRTVIRFLLWGLLATAALAYAFVFLSDWAVAQHRQGARYCYLSTLKAGLWTCYERNGRWPQTLRRMAIEEWWGGVDPVDPASGRPLPDRELAKLVDPISDRLWLYYPDAEFGTEAILVAQPEALSVGLWPFVTVRRWGLQADGRPVELGSAP
ncbi:MAG: hypothetical protein ABSG86_03705 [Thermoguttaceae bacterium]